MKNDIPKWGIYSPNKLNRMQDQLQYIHNLAAVNGGEPYTMLIYYERQKREADKIIQECGYNVKTMLVSDLQNGSVFNECTMDELHKIENDLYPNNPKQ